LHRPGCFVVLPYRPDQDWRGQGVALFIGCTVLGSLALGLAGSLVLPWLSLPGIFPVLSGILLGLAGWQVIRRSGMRSPPLAIGAGILGGSLLVVSTQFFNYQRLRPGGGFLDYLDATARRGELVVRIARQGPQVARHIGRGGTYLRWLIEMAGAAGAAAMLMGGAAKRPYCRACRVWKPEGIVGQLKANQGAPTLSPCKISKLLREGDLGRLAREEAPYLVPIPEGHFAPLTLRVAVCHHCGTDGTIDVCLEQLIRVNRERAYVKQIAHVTYPGTAFPLLEQHFTREP
jgi:hypothetical protein